MQSGFKIGLVHLIIIGLATMITTLYLGEIANRTKQNHQLTGYAGLYLGRVGRKIMFYSFGFGIYAALLAYLIAEGASISALLFGTAQYAIYCGVGFWIALSLLSYFGLKALEEGESFGVTLILIMIISIAILLWNKIDVSNLQYVNFSNVFLPFGVILFAFLGFSAIPELERIFGNDRRPMKRSIIIAYIFSFIVYLVFAAVVLGYKGSATPQIATLALGKPFILLGMITIFTSYLALSIAFIDTLKFDFGKTKFKSWLWVITIPIILYLVLEAFNLANFTTIIGIGGVISGGIDAILILMMVKRAKKLGTRKPEYSMPHSEILNWILIAMFTLGALLEIFYTIKSITS
jgi:amino acid transporter